MFYKKRIVTVYPSYVLLLFLFYFASNYNMTDQAIKNILLIPAFFLGIQCFFQDLHRFAGDSLFWFVSVILFMYFIYPVLQIMINKLEKNRKNCLLICYLVIVYIGLVYCYFRNAQVLYYNSPIFRIPEFAFGIILAQMYKQKDAEKINGLFALVSIVLCFLCVSILSTKEFLNHVKFIDMPLLYNFITVPLTAIIILGLSNIKSEFVIKICHSRVVGYLNRISFAFYLTQGLMIRFVRSKISDEMSYLGGRLLYLLI